MTITRGNFLAIIGLICERKLLPEAILSGKVMFDFLLEPVHAITLNLSKGKLAYAPFVR